MDFNFSEFINEFPNFFMRHYFMVGAWCVAVVLLIVVQIRLMAARIPKATTNTAVGLVNHDGGVFVDLRSNDVFSKGHIANAINMSASEIKSGKINRIENRRNNPVILVGKDKFDSESFNCARFLKKQGFTKVFILEGGMLEWFSANLPTTTKK